jgi:hypothetical protein
MRNGWPEASGWIRYSPLKDLGRYLRMLRLQSGTEKAWPCDLRGPARAGLDRIPASRILRKWGWRGQGMGRREDGITQPVIPKLRQGQGRRGLGYKG